MVLFSPKAIECPVWVQLWIKGKWRQPEAALGAGLWFTFGARGRHQNLEEWENGKQTAPQKGQRKPLKALTNPSGWWCVGWRETPAVEIKYQMGNPTEPLRQIFLLQRGGADLGTCQCEELKVKVILGGPKALQTHISVTIRSVTTHWQRRRL